MITTCASKKCRFDQKCEIVKGSAICRPQRPILTCAAVTCLAGTRCVIQNGVPRCLRACQHLVCPPFQNCTEVNGEAFCRGQNPVVSCAAVTCFRGLQCVIRNGQAFCKRPCKSRNDCRQGASCQSGFCECNRFCPAVVSLPVCGSDGKTYGSVCEMDVAACAKNVEIKSVLCSGKQYLNVMR